MFAETLAWVRQMSLEDRVCQIPRMLETCSDDDERAHLHLILVHALRGLRRYAEAIESANLALAQPMGDQLRWRILGMRALVEVGLADDVAAERTLAEMDTLPPHEPWLGEYYSVRGRLMAMRGRREAYPWFERAVEAFRSAGADRDAEAAATWAALLAVDTSEPVARWVNELPTDDLYRLAIEADAMAQTGDVAGAAAIADAVLSNPVAETHAQARAMLVQAFAAHSTNQTVRALVLGERALSLALTNMVGYEPRLVERIRRTLHEWERGVAG